MNLKGDVATKQRLNGNTKPADGFSPIVDVKEVESGHEVSITDRAGKKSFTVLNGKQGEKGELPIGLLERNYSPSIVNKASGTTIPITDSANVKPLNIIPYGKSEQRAYEGYQLFDISKVISNEYVVNNGDGTITINASDTSAGVTAATPCTLKDYAPLLQVGETYILNANSTASTRQQIYLLGCNIAWVFGTSMVITEEMLNGEVYFYADATNSTATISEIMLCEGTTVKPYEPFVGGQPSPSMAYPQPIVSAGQRYLTGKNLIDYTKAKARSGSSKTQTIEIIDGGVKWTGDYFFEIPTEIEVGKTAVFSCESSEIGSWCFIYSDGTYANTVSLGVAIISEKEVVGINVYKLNPSVYGTDMIATNMQLEYGTVSTEYEPYTGGVAKVIDVGIEQKLLGKNFFDVDKFLSLAGNSDYYEKTENGNMRILKTDGRANSLLGLMFTLPSGTYCVSSDVVSEISVYDTNKIVIGNPLYYGNTFTLTEKTNLSVKFVGNVGDIISNVQIELGEVKTEYEPYKEPQTLSIPYVLREGDKIPYAEGKRVETRNRIVFDGTENWTLGATSDGVNNRFQITLNNSIYNFAHTDNLVLNAKSNCFSYFETMGVIPPTNSFRVVVVNTSVYVLLNPSTKTIPLEDLDAWKSKLVEMYANGNPLYIEYELVNPIETDLTDEDIAQYEALRMNYPNTTIVSDAFTEVEYVADTKCYIDKKFKELQDNLISATAQLL